MSTATSIGRVLPWTACGLGLGLTWVSGHELQLWHGVVLGAALVLAGIPHGALDHVVVGARVHGRGLRWGAMAAYVALIPLTVMAFWLSPLLAFAAFLVGTAVHFAQGEAWYLRGEARAGRVAWHAELFLRGGLPVCLPVVLHWGSVASLVASLDRLFGSDSARALEAYGPWVRLTVTSLLLLAGLVLVLASAVGRRQANAILELSGLALLFVVANPVVAITLYLCLWHAPRHIVRLVEHTRARGTGWRPFLAVYVRTLPTTAIALVFLAALGGYLAVRSPGAMDIVALVLVGVAALSVPHIAVVTWMGRPARFAHAPDARLRRDLVHP